MELIPLVAEATMEGGRPVITLIDYGRTYDKPVPTTTMNTNIGVRVTICWPGYTFTQIAIASRSSVFRDLVSRALGDAVARFFERHDDFKGYRSERELRRIH